jgi:hypothetical protein
VLYGAASYRTPGSIFNIGSEADSGHGWERKIVDIKIFSSALSESEVINLYTDVMTDTISVLETSAMAFVALGFAGLSLRRFKKASLTLNNVTMS